MVLLYQRDTKYWEITEIYIGVVIKYAKFVHRSRRRQRHKHALWWLRIICVVVSF